MLAVTFAGQPLLGAMGPSLPLPVFGDPTLALYEAIGSERASWRRLLRPRVWASAVRLAMRGRLPSSPQGQDYRQLGGAAIVDAECRLVWRRLQEDPADYPRIEQIAAEVGEARLQGV